MYARVCTHVRTLMYVCFVGTHGCICPGMYVWTYVCTCVLRTYVSGQIFTPEPTQSRRLPDSLDS